MSVEPVHKILNPYIVKETILSNGERMPLLIRRCNGIPIEEAMYWIVSDRRPLGKQANTLQQDLRNISILYLWSDARGTDLKEVIRSPNFFSLAQLNDLDRFCRDPMATIVAEAARTCPGSPSAIPASRSNSKTRPKPPGRMQVRNRMASIGNFLEHISCDHLSRLSSGSEARSSYDRARTEMLKKWEARYKSLDVKDTGDPRMGLDRPTLERLQAVIDPLHPENPWPKNVRERNQLLVRLLWMLGVRRGEMLAIQTFDVKYSGDIAILTIVRRPDNPNDRRIPKPSVKTRGRELVVVESLAKTIYDYTLSSRKTYPLARKHPFLFVSSVDGQPMSMSSLNKLFKALRTRVPGLPDGLCPHIMRYTWNDDFSAASDRANPRRTEFDSTEEGRMRRYLMGWSDKSTMPTRYTKRWTIERANKSSLAIQNKIMSGQSNELEI